MDFQLETQRLKLRPIAACDIEELHRLWIDPEVRRFLWDDVVISIECVTNEIDRSIDSFINEAFGLWALSTRASNEIIGFCGLRRFGSDADVELLYGLLPSHWHQGLATEASHAVLEYGFARLGLDLIYAGSDPPNTASQNVMQRLGMSFMKRIKINDLDADYFAISRHAFLSQCASAPIST